INCQECLSQTFYKRQCHKSYVKKFLISKEYNQIYTISDDIIVIGTDLNDLNKVIEFEGHTSNLVDFAIYQNILYTISVQGDVILFDLFNANILRVFNCTQQSGEIGKKIWFTSTYQYILFQELSQSTEDQKNSQLFILLDSLDYLVADLLSAQIYSYSFQSTITDFLKIQSQKYDLGCFIISIQSYSFYKVSFKSFIQSPQIEQITIPLDELTSQIFYFEDQNYFFISNMNNTISSFFLDKDKQISSLQNLKIDLKQTYLRNLDIEIFKMLCYSQSVYIASTYRVGDLLYYSLMEKTKGIIIYSLSSNQIQEDFSCFSLPYNTNYQQSSIQIKSQENKLVVYEQSQINILDLTKLALINQARILSQRIPNGLPIFIFEQFDLIIFLDYSYINFISYYTLEFLSFYELPQCPITQFQSQVYLNTKQLQIYLFCLEFGMFVINLESFDVQYYTIISLDGVWQSFYIFENQMLLFIQNNQIQIYQLDPYVFTPTLSNVLNTPSQGLQNFIAFYVDSTNLIAYASYYDQYSFQTDLATISLKSLNYNNLSILNYQNIFNFVIFEKYNIALAIIYDQYYSYILYSAFYRLDDTSQFVMKSLPNQVSESYIQAEEYIYLQIETQIQQFNLLNNQINIFSFSDTFFCYQYNAGRDILLIGLNDNTIIYGNKSLSNINIIKTKFIFYSLSLDLTSNSIIVNNQMIQGSPTDISLLKIHKKSSVQIANIINPNIFKDYILFVPSLSIFLSIQNFVILLYDYRNGNLLFQYSFQHQFQDYYYNLSDLIEQSKFCLNGRTQLSLYSIKQNEQMQYQIDLISTVYLNFIFDISTQFDCISVEFIDSNSKNISLFSFENLTLIKQIKSDVSLGINELFFSLKHNIQAYYMNLQNYNEIIFYRNEKVISSIFLNDNFYMCKQIDQDYIYFIDQNQLVYFISFSLQKIVYTQLFLNLQMQVIHYFADTKEIFAVGIQSESKQLIYYGILDLETQQSSQKYVINCNKYQDMIKIDNLDLVFLFSYDKKYYIYQKTSGNLLQTIYNQLTMIFLPSLNMLAYWNYDFATKSSKYYLYDLYSVYDETYYYVEKNISLILKFQNELENAIYATSPVESNLYKIDLSNKKLKLVMKRGSKIHSIIQISSQLIVIASMSEIILFNTSTQSIISAINFNNLFIQIQQILNADLLNLNFRAITIKKPQLISIFEINKNKLIESSVKNINLNQVVNKIVIINLNLSVLTFSSGDLMILNTSSLQQYQVQNFHSIKYEVILLDKYSNNLNQTEDNYFILSYSSNCFLQISQISFSAQNQSIQLNYLMKQQFPTKILQIQLDKDQKFAIFSLQDSFYIYQLCIQCVMSNPTSKIEYQQYFLPFIRYHFKFKIYEDLGYLIAFTDIIYAIYSLKTTNILYVSTKNYMNNTIYDINIITNNYLLISFQQTFEIHEFNITAYLLTQKGHYNVIYSSQQQNVKIFNTQVIIYKDNNKSQLTSLSLAGYDIGKNMFFFNYLPYLEKKNNYNCIIKFENSNQYQLNEYINDLQQMNENMQFKIGQYFLQIAQNQQIQNKMRIVNNNYTLSLPNLTQSINISIIITGTDVYLDRINYNSLSLSYSQIILQNATLYITSYVMIQGFQSIIINQCKLIYLSSDSKQFGILFSKIDSLKIKDFYILNQTIPYNFDGIQILNFNSIDIENLFIENNNLNLSSQFIKFDGGTKISIQNFNFKNNKIFQEKNFNLIEIIQTSFIQFLNLYIISNNQKYENYNQIAGYFVGVFTFQQLNIDSAQIQLNQNLLFLNISNYLVIEDNSKKYSIAFIDSIFTLQSALYEKNSFSEQINLSAIQIQNIQMSLIQNCTFNSNTLESSPLIQIQNIDYIQLNLTTFSLNQCLNCVFSQTCNQISVEKSVFSQNLSKDSGSCIMLKNFSIQSNKSVIEDSLFDNNFSQNSGGAIFLQNVDIQILNSIFSSNKASIGGAIRYLDVIPRFVSKVIKSENINQQSCDVQFLNNKAFIFGNNIGSIPKYLAFYSNQKLKHIEDLQLENIRSGSIIENLQISLLDEEQNIVNIIPPQNIHFTQKILNEIKVYQIQFFSNNQNEIDIKYNTIFTYQQSSNNTFNISGMKIQGMPKKSSQIQISAPFLRQDGLNNTYTQGKNFSILVTFRDCQAGEFFSQVSQQIFECQQCENNTYSLIEPSLHQAIQCKQCQFDKADSCYLNVINVKSGFWRLNQQDDSIIECSNQPKNCQCQSLNETKYCCIKGFIGPLCEVCDSYGVVWSERFGAAGKYSCSACYKYDEILFRELIKMALLTLYFLYSVKQTVEKASKYIICQTLRRLNFLLIGKSGESDKGQLYIKLFINFVQVTSAACSDQLIFFSISFFNIFGVFANPSVVSNNSLDCLFAMVKQIPIEFIRGLWVSFIPIIYILLGLLLYFTQTDNFFNRPHHKRFLYVAFNFGFVSFQSGTVSQLIQIMSCRKIGNQLYIKSQLNKICYSNEHLNYIVFLIVPLLFLWVLIIPLLVLYRIYIKRKVINEPIQIIKFGFICSNYKQIYFYWEFIRIVQRLTIVIIANVLSDQQTVLKLILSIMLIQIYNRFLIRLKPYRDNISQDSRDQQYLSSCKLNTTQQILQQKSSFINSKKNQQIKRKQSLNFTKMNYLNFSSQSYNPSSDK
ncbi:hypothetical protein ABPG74_011135, partial [Tetrahymena malaccensis]